MTLIALLISWLPLPFSLSIIRSIANFASISIDVARAGFHFHFPNVQAGLNHAPSLPAFIRSSRPAFASLESETMELAALLRASLGLMSGGRLSASPPQEVKTRKPTYVVRKVRLAKSVDEKLEMERKRS